MVQCKKEAKEVFNKLKKVIDCKLLEEPEDYAERVLVTTCAMAKGIEFDGVIIPNCSSENYRNTIDKNILRFILKNGNIYIDKGDKNEKCFCEDFY